MLFLGLFSPSAAASFALTPSLLFSISLLSMFVSKETRNSFAEIAAAADRRGSACGMAASAPEQDDLNFSGAPTTLFPRLTVNHDGRTSFSLFVEPADCLSAGSRYQQPDQASTTRKKSLLVQTKWDSAAIQSLRLCTLSIAYFRRRRKKERGEVFFVFSVFGNSLLVRTYISHCYTTIDIDGEWYECTIEQQGISERLIKRNIH